MDISPGSTPTEESMSERLHHRDPSSSSGGAGHHHTSSSSSHNTHHHTSSSHASSHATSAASAEGAVSGVANAAIQRINSATITHQGKQNITVLGCGTQDNFPLNVIVNYFIIIILLNMGDTT